MLDNALNTSFVKYTSLSEMESAICSTFASFGIFLRFKSDLYFSIFLRSSFLCFSSSGDSSLPGGGSSDILLKNLSKQASNEEGVKDPSLPSVAPQPSICCATQKRSKPLRVEKLSAAF